jgi:hypothetical protein
MTRYHTKHPISKIAVLVLLLIACRNAPSHIAQMSPDTAHSGRAKAVQPSPHHSDSTTYGPEHSAFRDFVLDLNGDGLLDTISLTLSPSDTNYFIAVGIAIQGYHRQSFRVADTAKPWTDFDDWFADSSANAVHTRRFFVQKGVANTVLLLFGYIGEGGSRDGFTIIRIEHNEARQVLDQITQHLDIENVLSLRDLDNDGRFELICNYTFQFDGSPDTLGGLVGRYNPYYVYTIGDTCLLNKPLMRRYNQENYVFAGYEFSEEIKVFYPDDRTKRPWLWKP